MSDSNSVRFSRDGDQFHYLWASRKCLELLSPRTNLVAITIEGSSPEESLGTDSEDNDGEELIDVGEYYGSQELKNTEFIRYTQLKHSTQNPTDPWQPSGLEKTIKGFSDRYKAIKKKRKVLASKGLLEFVFLTNRPIVSNFLKTVTEVAEEKEISFPRDLKKLEKFTNMKGEGLVAFCKTLHLRGGEEHYIRQRQRLSSEVRSYLVGDDRDAPIRLKELVTSKVLSQSIGKNAITKTDVLLALNSDESRLFPVQSEIEKPDKTVSRKQDAEIFKKIHSDDSFITVITAKGGIGKTVLTTKLLENVSPNTPVIVYDCFGSGGYRRQASPRHRHKDALVQIANELAAKGFCDLLIPTNNADTTDLLKAFRYRLMQAAERTERLCIVIDAADNAQMAAEEFGEERSFVQDLLEVESVDNVKVIVLCRPERLNLFRLPRSACRLELQAFNIAETSEFLKERFRDANDQDVAEFHKLTSGNPRLQVTALAQVGSLQEILRSLGENPRDIDTAIASLLEEAIERAKEASGSVGEKEIDALCEALAVLRPFVPISVLAATSDVSEEAVESFALTPSLRLLVTNGAVQFRDEPVESWFRDNFRPKPEQLNGFIERLKPLANKSAYVAATLPQLMLEAGQLEELIKIALESSYLPNLTCFSYEPIDENYFSTSCSSILATILESRGRQSRHRPEHQAHDHSGKLYARSIGRANR